MPALRLRGEIGSVTSTLLRSAGCPLRRSSTGSSYTANVWPAIVSGASFWALAKASCTDTRTPRLPITEKIDGLSSTVQRMS